MKIILVPLLIVLLAGASGCLAGAPDHLDWAAPDGSAPGGAEPEIQSTLDDYAKALVDKDREAFLAQMSSSSGDYLTGQQQLFDNLQAVPFDRYEIELESYTEGAEGSITAKITTAYTLKESFTGLPIPVRSAVTMTKQDGAWKLAGDATEQVLGKPRDAQLEDFGKVEVTQGEHVIILHHAQAADIAGSIRDQADASYPRIQEALPGVDLPKVPVRVFADTSQIDLAFPGQWADWVGGASRQLGNGEDDGGEVILDATLYRDVASYDQGINSDLIAHELTHVALFPLSGVRTPPFLVEGLADYVAGIEASPDLAARLRRGENLTPSLGDLYQPASFDVLINDEVARTAYDVADSAVLYLQVTYGDDQVMRLLREFKRRELDSEDQDQLVDEVFRSVLGVSWSDFENGWRSYVVGG